MSDQPKGRAGQTAGAAQKAVTTGAEAAQDVASAGMSAAEQFTRQIAEMSLTALPDVDALTTAYRRNMEALSAAYRAALEGTQEVARRNSEIVRQAWADMEEAVKAVADAQTPEAKAATQIEFLKSAYQRAVANMQELGELIQKANAEAIGVLNRRFSEGLDEIKAIMEQPGSKS